MPYFLTEEAAVSAAQADANLSGRDRFVYWNIYGCQWSVRETRAGSGANVNYERVVHPGEWRLSA